METYLILCNFANTNQPYYYEKSLLFAISIILLGIPIEDAFSGIKREPKPISFKPIQKGNTTRPQMPAHQRISAEYLDGILYIEFKIPEGNCEVKYTDTVTGLRGSSDFDSTSPANILIGSLRGRLELSITTSFGNEYEAVIDINE